MHCRMRARSLISYRASLFKQGWGVISLKFIGDAISLSGLTGTKAKCDVIGRYYGFWWKITSGGPRISHRYPTALVELDAATGEVHIKETGETVLGSGGHAVDLKVRNHPYTKNLKVILIEKDRECYDHLKSVIRRRWPSISLSQAEGSFYHNHSRVYLLNKTLDEALEEIERLHLGNAIFFFDPLRSVGWDTIGNVASRRLNDLYATGTEFIIFVFTSDWFLGRDELEPLPTTTEEEEWTEEERNTVLEADRFFGDTQWRTQILNSSSIESREDALVELYKNKLHKWFRYVLPMPFNPKDNQIFHLVLCSNYAIGVRATRDFYNEIMRNPKFSPNNPSAYKLFKGLHPETLRGLRGNQRPSQWKVLWKIIREHEEGICDCWCADLAEIEAGAVPRQYILDWLQSNNYLRIFNIENAWKLPLKQYKLNWQALRNQVGIRPPNKLIPLSPNDM